MREHSWSFLLSIAAMPMLGCPSDDDDGTAAGTTTTTATTGSETSSTGTDTGTTTTSAEATSFPPSESSSTTSDVDLCVGAPMPPLCEQYGDHFVVDCFPDNADNRDAYVHDCVCGAFYAAIYTEACGAAAE